MFWLVWKLQWVREYIYSEYQAFSNLIFKLQHITFTCCCQCESQGWLQINSGDSDSSILAIRIPTPYMSNHLLIAAISGLFLYFKTSKSHQKASLLDHHAKVPLVGCENLVKISSLACSPYWPPWEFSLTGA